MDETGDDGGRRRELPPALKEIEARLWDKASVHEREATLLVGKATDQQDLPHVLASLRSVAPRDAIEARLVALVLALSQASAENLRWARVVQPYPDGVADRARLAAVRLAEAACRCAEALARHRSGGATEHRVTVTHAGPAAELAVGVRVRPGGEGDGNRRRPQAQQRVGHAPQPAVRRPDQERAPVPRAGDGQGALPAARRG
jgi:hypothetical protein